MKLSTKQLVKVASLAMIALVAGCSSNPTAPPVAPLNESLLSPPA
jgi:hypothetical protein